MAVDPAIVADNTAARERLRSRVQSLTDAQLGRDAGGGWTVAVALAHLAFWDRRALLSFERWEQGQPPPANFPSEYEIDLLNDALLAEWRALAPREAGRLALAAADAVDAKVAALAAPVMAAIEARAEPWRLRRSRHRNEHLDQVDRALGAGG